MSGLAFTVQVADTTSAQLSQVTEAFGSGRVNAWLTQDLIELTKSHLVALAGARHRSAAPVNFYGRASSAVSGVANALGITISIRHQGLAQRFFGGTINPVTGKYLAIPAREEACGVRPRQYPENLVPLYSRAQRRVIALVQAEDTERVITKGKNKGQLTRAPKDKAAAHGLGAVVYWLVRSVTQQPDPSVLPTESAYLGALTLRLGRLMEQIKNV